MDTQKSNPEFDQRASSETSSSGSRTFVEWMDVAGSDLVATIKDLVAQGNVRRIVLRDSNGKELFTVPLTAGVAVGGIAVLAVPVLAAIGGVAALVSKVTMEIVRTDIPEDAEVTVQEIESANPQESSEE